MMPSTEPLAARGGDVGEGVEERGVVAIVGGLIGGGGEEASLHLIGHLVGGEAGAADAGSAVKGVNF